MKIKTVYCCEFCEEFFTSAMDCEKHEATHFNLTHDDYLEWKELCNIAGLIGRSLASSSTPEKRKAFDDAVKELVEFEIKHNLDNVIKKPRQFYF